MYTTDTSIPPGFYLLGFVLFIGLIVWVGSHFKTRGEEYWGDDDIHQPNTITDPAYSASIGNNYHDSKDDFGNRTNDDDYRFPHH